MAILPKINQLKQSKAAQEAMKKPIEQASTPQSVASGFQSMGEFKPQQPVLQKRNAQEDYNATRSQALGHESNLADPEKAQKFWNASPYEYWTEQVKANPESTYAIVNQMFASNETPEEKAKRERREALGETFRGLGNLIGNAANLYYATKGGTPIDLNTANEKHRERMQRIKDKQDALDEQRKNILMNAKIGDITAARQLAAKKEEREYNAKVTQNKIDADAKAAELKYLRELGIINAKQANELAKIEKKADYDKKLAEIKHGYSMALKSAPTYYDAQNESKVVDSLQDGNGNVWTRNTRLTTNELSQLAEYVEHPEDFMVKKEDAYGNVREEFDALAAARNAMDNNRIPEKVLSQMGLKKGKHKTSGLGWGSNKESEDETDW